MSLEDRIRARAAAEGFEAVGIAAVSSIGPEPGLRLDRFVELGRHGVMDWMAEGERAPRRRHPSALWPEAKSLIALGLNYGPDYDPLDTLKRPGRAAISVYAQGRDYHLVVKKKLKSLGTWLQRETGQALKVFVDTAPLMEKPLAEAAGIGWQGKHTNLVSREFGSWLFLGAILTEAELAPDAPHDNHCGACHACLDICPTKAFPAPYELDARRCISYLTIEFDGVIPLEFRQAMGNRIYGCDDCLAACPWNKFAQTAHDNEIQARAALKEPHLLDLAGLDDAGFREMFATTAVKRIGRDRFIRNVCIALGNSGNAAAIPMLLDLSEDAAAPVRAMAAWALKQLMKPADFVQHSAKRRAVEHDAAVLNELT